MPPRTLPLKRGRPAAPQDDSSEGEDNASPPQRRKLSVPQNSVQRRALVQAQSQNRFGQRLPPQRIVDGVEGEGEEEEEKEEDEGKDQDEINIVRLARKLVRLALASEHTRQPIRRNDITTKVLGEGNSKYFKPVFAQAQSSLRQIFGMEFVELPTREKITVSQKRAAQRTQGGGSSSKSYMLITTLPHTLRASEILGAGTANPKEEAYVGLVTVICSLIYLNGSSLSETKLDRYLKRLNIEITTPLDKTEKLLATMCSQGYLNRVKDNTGGESSWEYHLGPRAKMEIGKSGVVNLVDEVYGVQAPADLEERVGRNIGVEELVGRGDARRPNVSTQRARRGTGEDSDNEDGGGDYGDGDDD